MVAIIIRISKIILLVNGLVGVNEGRVQAEMLIGSGKVSNQLGKPWLMC